MKQATNKRTFSGTVIRSSMQKTIVVSVARMKVHSKYGKRYTITKNYLVHDETNAHKPGEQVAFVECRPLSKNKRWRVIEAVVKK